MLTLVKKKSPDKLSKFLPQEARKRKTKKSKHEKKIIKIKLKINEIKDNRENK